MRSINKVILSGHLGKDPDYQVLEKGITVANISLATTEMYKDKNGQSLTDTEWHTIVAWRGLAELAKKYLYKGSHVLIEGRLKTRSYVDKNGANHYVTEILAEELIMLDKKMEK